MPGEIVRNGGLAKGSGFVTASGRPPEEEALVAVLVAAMHSSLKTYGKPWDGSIMQGWFLALKVARDVDVAAFELAVERWLSSEEEFPSPRQILDMAREIGRERVDLEVLRRTEEEARREDAAMAENFRRNHPGEDPRQVIKALGGMKALAQPMPAALPDKTRYRESSIEEIRETNDRRRAMLANRVPATGAGGGA